MPTQPLRDQAFTRNSDAKAFTVRSINRSESTVVLAATSDGAGHRVSYTDLEANYTAA